jgi:hypothetical protein
VDGDTAVPAVTRLQMQCDPVDKRRHDPILPGTSGDFPVIRASPR